MSSDADGRDPTPRRKRRATLRGRLSWSATGVVAAWMVVLAIGANLAVGALVSAQADELVRVRAEAVAQTVGLADDGSVTVSEARDDAALDVGTWIVAADGTVVERPPGLGATLNDLAIGNASGAERTVELGSPVDRLLYVLPIEDNGTRIATVVTSTSLDPYQGIRQITLLTSIALAVIVLLIVHIVLRASMTRALRPVLQMSTQAGEWSSDEVERRFEPAPMPSELADLARTLNTVLDRLAAVYRHERQLVDELSHELRTPLARMQAEIELAGSAGAGPEVMDVLDVIAESGTEMQTIIGTLMSTARERYRGALGQAGVRIAVEKVVRGLDRPSVVEVRTDVPDELQVGVDAPLLERLLVPILENAARHAVAAIRIEGRADEHTVAIRITDDGPGVPTDLSARVFEPGFRAGGDEHDGAGLGLALAKRLAEAGGGSLEVETRPSGAAFLIRLPPG